MHHSKPHKDEFIFNIIEALQLNPVEFEQNRRKGAAYETIIYNWIIDLFDQGKHINEAVAIILEKRIQIIYSINEDFMLEYDIMDNRNYEKALSKLETVPIFFNLREKEKQGVKRKINALIQTRLWSISEIVEFTKQIIKNTINSEDTDSEYKRTSHYKNQSLDKNSMFFSEYTNLLISKTILNETTIQSP